MNIIIAESGSGFSATVEELRAPERCLANSLRRVANPLAYPWMADSIVPPLQSDANGATAGTIGIFPGNYFINFWDPADRSFSPSQSSSAVLTNLPTVSSNRWAGVVVRWNGLGSGYVAYCLPLYGLFFLERWDSGASVVLGTASGTFNEGDQISLLVNGSTLQVMHGSTIVLIVSDATYSTGQPGVFYAYGGGGPTYLSDWQGCSGAVTAAVPTLLSVVSRMGHAGVGTFDIPLSLSSITNEPRRKGGNSSSYVADDIMTLVFTFDGPVYSGTFAVVDAAAFTSGAQFVGNTVLVTLPPMQDRQYITVRSLNINGTGVASVRFRRMWGDVDNSLSVTASDVALIDGHTGETLTNANCMYDCNVDGVIGTGAAETSGGSSVVMHASTLPIISSRRYHNGWPFDIVLDQTALIGGSVTVEPRMTTPDATAGSFPDSYNGAPISSTIVFTLDVPVTTVGTPTAVDSLGNPYGSGISAHADGNNAVVVIDDCANVKRVTVTLPGINGTTTLSINMGFLIGDVNGSRVVNISDTNASHLRDGFTAFKPDLVCFKCDLDGDGTISSGTSPTKGIDSNDLYSGMSI